MVPRSQLVGMLSMCCSHIPMVPKFQWKLWMSQRTLQEPCKVTWNKESQSYWCNLGYLDETDSIYWSFICFNIWFCTHWNTNVTITLVEEALSPVKLAIHLCTLDKKTRNPSNVPPEIISLEVQGPSVFVPTKVLHQRLYQGWAFNITTTNRLLSLSFLRIFSIVGA